MHCFGNVEPSGLEQFIGRRASSTLSEITAVTFAEIDPALNFVSDNSEDRMLLAITEMLCGSCSENEAAESQMLRA